MRLGQVLRKWRHMSELDIRAAAKEIGIDPTTLHRVEQGRMPSAATLRQIIIWLIGDCND